MLQLHTWQITFAYTRHEAVVGAGNLGLLLAHDVNLGGNGAAVGVQTMVQGTNPLRFDLSGLETGTEYFVRVAAQNSRGFGPESVVARATPRGQPSKPSSVALSVVDGESLKVTWAAPASDGGTAVLQHKVQWYRNPGTTEAQIVTTSADQGTAAQQAVDIGADIQGISGYFQLSFKGETTDNIRWDAPATGAGSVKAKLERLSTIGTVDVTRTLSRMVVPGLRVSVKDGINSINATVSSAISPSQAGLDNNDIIFVAGVKARVKYISSDGRSIKVRRPTSLSLCLL